jgi:predicted metal-dependent hydrolase
MKEKDMQINDIEVEIVRKKVRYLRLVISPMTSRIRVSAPTYVSDDAIRQFVISKRLWIAKQINKFESLPKKPNPEFVTGETHYLWGRQCALQILCSQKRTFPELKDGEILLTTRGESNAEQREKMLNEWYREQLKTVIPALISRWEPVIGVNTSAFGVKNMKTRWGTCNTKTGKIWLNLQLAKKPPHCLEYVVVHELVHLHEKNHGERFKAYMDRFLPNWREIKKELNRGV